MTGLNHGITGAIIALQTKNPAVALPLSFASHFVQDLLPHWDYSVSRSQAKRGKFFTKKFNAILTTDFFLSLILMAILGVLFPSQKWLIWGSMIAAACPDLMWAYYRLYLGKIKKREPRLDPLTRLHDFVQWSQTGWGILIEIGWASAGLALILFYYR